jgi:hypothetical protein
VLAGLRAAANAVPKRDVGVSGDLIGGCWETLLSWGGSARVGAPTGKESPTLIPCRGEVRDTCCFSVNSPKYFKLTKTMRTVPAELAVSGRLCITMGAMV